MIIPTKYCITATTTTIILRATTDIIQTTELEYIISKTLTLCEWPIIDNIPYYCNDLLHRVCMDVLLIINKS